MSDFATKRPSFFLFDGSVESSPAPAEATDPTDAQEIWTNTVVYS